MGALPVIYKSQRNAWMNSEICSPKALLLMDNCSAHPEELKTSDGSVTRVYISPSKHSLADSADGSMSLASNEQLLHEETSSNIDLQSRS